MFCAKNNKTSLWQNFKTGKKGCNKLQIYNTLSRKKENLVTLVPGEVKIYACGPTVYNYIHIGNARPMCVFDVLRRYLEYRGYKVSFMQNFTDIDDKIINKANETGTTFKTVSEKFIEEYKIDARGLNIKEPTYQPKATENIDQIIKIVSGLIEKGFAYENNGDVFFRVKRFKGYGALSHMPMQDLEMGVRIEVNSQKEDPLDFVLWKAAKANEPYWESPWGKGRPGWHIECTAMINKVFGSTIDIHCGGQDLIFPHHENEIAQSVCYTCKDYVHYWMHNGYINVDNKKMSKSLGNFFTVRDVAEKFGYEAIRFMMLQVHYRSPINYSYDIMKQCVSALERIKNCQNSLNKALVKKADNEIEFSQSEEEKLLKFKQNFIGAMDDDLNTADAITAIFELVTEINTSIVNKSKISKGYLTLASKIFNELTSVLGILYQNEDSDENVDEEIKELVAQRQQARKNRDYVQADKLRNEILARGYILEDTSDGVVIKRQN